jgi:tRNA-binding protein|tara:strand:- start:778 stop:1164 length:387 start_codon:yes stop_codon:yes gene_type:complete
MTVNKVNHIKMKRACIINNLQWKEFERVELTIGTIIDAQSFEQARNPAYILHVDFGEKIGIKKSSAQITALYSIKELIGKKVMAVINFPPKQIGPIMSECLVTGFKNENGDIVLAAPEFDVPNGSRLI